MLVPAVNIHLTWLDLFKSALGGTVTVAVEVEHDGDVCRTLGGDCHVSGPKWWPRRAHSLPTVAAPIVSTDPDWAPKAVARPMLVVVGPAVMLPTVPSEAPPVLISQAAGHAPLV